MPFCNPNLPYPFPLLPGVLGFGCRLLSSALACFVPLTVYIVHEHVHIVNMLMYKILYNVQQRFLCIMYIDLYIMFWYNSRGSQREEGNELLSYKKLFDLLTERGYSATYWLRSNGLSPTIVNKLRKNERINSDTINNLCRLLDCQPGDIME